MSIATLPEPAPMPMWRTAWQRLRSRVQSAWRPAMPLFVFGAADKAGDWSAVLQGFASWCTLHEGQRCTVGLSGRCVLSRVAAPDLTLDEASQQALQQWAHYLDMDEASLRQDWVWRQVAAPGAHLLSAAPRGLIEGLQARAAEHGVRLEWVGPWWAQGVQAWLASLAALHADVAQAHTHVLHLLEPDLVTHVEARQMPAAPAHLLRVWVEVAPDQGAEQAMAREGLVVRLPEPHLQLDAPAPYHNHVWDHSLAATTIQGQAPCWQARS